jgi:hypothetical protein
MFSDGAKARRRAVRMSLGNDRTGLSRDRDERLTGFASAVIRLHNQVLDRRPTASTTSYLGLRRRSDMGREPLSVDLKAISLDVSDIAETDDHVAVWQKKLRIGRRAAGDD